jgi:hypothetical protein
MVCFLRLAKLEKCVEGSLCGVVAGRKRSCISAPPSKKSDDFNKVGLGYLFFMRLWKERLTDDETSIILGAYRVVLH